MRRMISEIATFLSKFIPVDNSKIIFESGRGRADDNPRYLYEYLKKNRPDYKLKYFIYKSTIHDGLDPSDIVYYNSFKYFYHISSTHILVKSNSVPSVVRKKKSQIYIQLWHGGEFKNCDHIAGTEFPKKHVREWDLFVSNNEMQDDNIRKQTGYSKQILTLGMIRTDYLNFNKNVEPDKFKDIIRLGLRNRTILYAPTFRDVDLDLNDQELSKKMEQVVDTIVNSLNPKDVLLLRLHPLLKGFSVKKDYPVEIIDVSPIEKIEDVLLASDILITDYSSIIYDFATLVRPIIFYIYDNEEYIRMRGYHYLNIDNDIPGKYAKNEYQLKNLIDEIGPEFDKKYVCKFNHSFNKYNDGHVGDRLVRVIDNIIK